MMILESHFRKRMTKWQDIMCIKMHKKMGIMKFIEQAVKGYHLRVLEYTSAILLIVMLQYEKLKNTIFNLTDVIIVVMSAILLKMII